MRLAVFFRCVSAARASLAGVVRRHGQQCCAAPLQLLVQLLPEFTPALVKDGAVQAGFLPDLPDLPDLSAVLLAVALR